MSFYGNSIYNYTTEYKIVKINENEYQLKANETIQGDPIIIPIPKDLVLQSGYVDGNKLILVLNDENSTKIEIDVSNLIEYVSSGSGNEDTIKININDKHEITAELNKKLTAENIEDKAITASKLADDAKIKYTYDDTSGILTLKGL